MPNVDLTLQLNEAQFSQLSEMIEQSFQDIYKRLDAIEANQKYIRVSNTLKANPNDLNCVLDRH